MELMNMRSFVTVYLIGVVFGGRQASRTVVKMMGIKVVLAELHQDGEVRWRGLGPLKSHVGSTCQRWKIGFLFQRDTIVKI